MSAISRASGSGADRLGAEHPQPRGSRSLGRSLAGGGTSGVGGSTTGAGGAGTSATLVGGGAGTASTRVSVLRATSQPTQAHCMRSPVHESSSRPAGAQLPSVCV